MHQSVDLCLPLIGNLGWQNHSNKDVVVTGCIHDDMSTVKIYFYINLYKYLKSIYICPMINTIFVQRLKPWYIYRFDVICFFWQYIYQNYGAESPWYYYRDIMSWIKEERKFAYLMVSEINIVPTNTKWTVSCGNTILYLHLSIKT